MVKMPDWVRLCCVWWWLVVSLLVGVSGTLHTRWQITLQLLILLTLEVGELYFVGGVWPSIPFVHTLEGRVGPTWWEVICVHELLSGTLLQIMTYLAINHVVCIQQFSIGRLVQENPALVLKNSSLCVAEIETCNGRDGIWGFVGVRALQNNLVAGEELEHRHPLSRGQFPHPPIWKEHQY